MITSLHNPLVKELRRLHQAKERQRQGVLLLEGSHLVEAAIAQGLSFSTVLYTETWQQHNPSLMGRIDGDRVQLVSEAVLQKVATTVHPDGVLATLTQATVHEKLSTPKALGLGVAIERLQDPGNLGTIIRTAAATNVDRLILSDGSVNPSNPKVLRASAGAWFQAPPIVIPDLSARIQHYQAQGIQIVATAPQAAYAYWDIDWCQPSLIVLGNEGAGLTGEIAAMADHTVHIPMDQGVESLNVAIACALMLYEAKRQRKNER